MIRGVVDNDHSAPSRAAGTASQMLEKSEVGFLVKFPFLALVNQLTITQSNGSEVTYTLARGMVPEDQIADFRRDPHPAPRPKLLEMDFVPCPQVHSRIPTQRSQFFLWRFCKPGSAWAMAGRGLRSRNPNCRNSRWHCRIPNWTRYCFSIKADRILPSQRFSPKP
jgi:hypothetical protein